MSDLLNEQEQVDALKQFWKRYGNLLLTVIAIILLAMAGWRFWQARETKIALVAAQTYEQLLNAVEAKQAVQVQADAQLLMSQYADTTYASLAGLILAGQEAQAGQLGLAKTHLQWVIAHSEDAGTQTVAKIRLARILLAEGSAQQALAQVNYIHNNAVALLVKGDCLVALHQAVAAKATYQLALTQVSQTDPLYTLLQMKLNHLPA